MSSGPVMIGPQSPVVNTPFQYQFPADTIAIYVQNYTRFTLLVNFSDTRPTATDSLNNQFDGVLAPGGRDVFYVQSRGASQAERSLNSIGAFTGAVWIMPVDRTNNLAFSGTASGNNDIWVSAYGPYDPPPPITGGMPLNVDLSSQPRVISLPPPGGQLLNGTWASGISANLTIQLYSLSQQNIANQQVAHYIFHLGLYPQVPAVGAPMQLRAALQAQMQDASFNPVGSPVTLYLFPIIGYASTTATWLNNIVLTPYFPLAQVLTVLPTAQNLAINLVKLGGNDMITQFNFAMQIDQNNQGFPPTYGGNATAQRWNGQFSLNAGLW